MSANTVNAEDPATNLPPEQQGWTERSLEEIEDMGFDPWDKSMGDTDEGGEDTQPEKLS